MSDSLDGIEIAETPAGVELRVKVVPGASRTAIVGTWGSALKVAVAAPAEAGKANAAVIRLLADVLDVAKGKVLIVGGHALPWKRIAVGGLTAAAVRQRLVGHRHGDT